MHLIAIGLGGVLGALARYLVDGMVAGRTGAVFPGGTLAVNLSGALLLAMLAALAIQRSTLPAAIRGPAMIGFLGGYTTFSTWTLGSLHLAEANLAGSLVAGIAAVVAGLSSGRALTRIDGQAPMARLSAGESDQRDGPLLSQAIVERLRKAGIAGATLLRGIEGHRAHARLHTASTLRLARTSRS